MDNTTNLNKYGIMYCATGKKFLEEAKISAKSVREHNRNINISLFLDDKNGLETEKSLFTSIHVIKKPQYSFADKIFAIRNSPYQHTIYLDTDTFIVDDISELFTILEKNDLALARLAPQFWVFNKTLYNAGIIIYRLNDKIKHVFKLWEKFWEDYYKKLFPNEPRRDDQPLLNELIEKNSVSVYALPTEYNFRPNYIAYAQNKIKIFHRRYLVTGPPKRRNAYIKLYNKNPIPRILFPKTTVLYIQDILKPRHFKEICIKLLFILSKKFPKIFSFLRTKLFEHRQLIFSFPWLINWLIPKQYREQLKSNYNEMNYKPKTERIIKV